MTHPLPWKPIAIVTTISTLLLSLLLLPACCCVRGPAPTAGLPPVTRIPAIGTEPIPTPKEAEAKAPTEGEMHDVDFHLDEFMFLRIHNLRGQLIPKHSTTLNFDDKMSFVMKVDKAEVGMLPESLDRLMNAYVFNYPNPPLRELKISMQGKQLVLTGIIHKIVDIPFTMWADPTASNGKIRLHPTKMSICGINGLGLLKAVGMTVEKMLKMPKERGVSAEGNDMLLDPQHLLPPPQIELKLTGVRVQGNELIQIFDAGPAPRAADAASSRVEELDVLPPRHAANGEAADGRRRHAGRRYRSERPVRFLHRPLQRRADRRLHAQSTRLRSARIHARLQRPRAAAALGGEGRAVADGADSRQRTADGGRSIADSKRDSR